MAESDSGNNRPSPPQGPMRLSRGVLGWIVFIGCALLLVMLLTNNMEKRRQLTFNEFLTYVKNGQLESVQIKEDLIVGRLKPEAREGQAPDAQLSFEVRSFPQLVPTVVEELRKTDAEFEVQAGGNLFVQLLVSLLPWVLIFAFIWFFIFRQIRSASTGAGMLGHFGRSRHRISSKEHTNVTFADVAGIDEAKDEVTELVEFLKEREGIALRS